MQKKLIALAVASAFAAPAFAATSNVDVYGSINVSIDRVDNGLDNWNRMVTNNNSFLGFKGSEDLGGGLSAVWQLETNVNFDSNQSNSSDAGNTFGTRNTYVGLASKSLGTVVFGTHDTPYKQSTGSLDNFVGTVGDYNAVFGNNGGNPSNLFDVRAANVIAYMSPAFSGFDVKAAYVMGLEAAETAPANASSAYSLSATYKNGPLFVTGAYEKHNDVGTVACNPGALCLGSGTADRDAWKIGAGFTIGSLKLGAIYESIDGDGGNSTIEHDSWGLNASYQMGAFTLKGAFNKAGELNNVNNSGAKMWAVGGDYAMSKRTTIQLTYAKMNNDSAASWDLGQGPQIGNSGTAASNGLGEDITGFSIGIKHTF